MQYFSRSLTPIDFVLELSCEAPITLGEIGRTRWRVRTAGVRGERSIYDEGELDAQEGFDEVMDEKFEDFLQRVKKHNTRAG